MELSKHAAALHTLVTTPEDGSRCGFGNFPVTVIPHYPLRLSDGVHLSVKFWFLFQSTKGTIFQDHGSDLAFRPNEPATAENLPAVLEYLPYRKHDFTFTRDWRHLWMSSHGYISVRVDMRGTGDSEGLYFDEYKEQEQKDGVQVIEWLAEQPWCNGRVGIIGKSWGGFNGLQLAFCQPKGLKAVISSYSTDNRYATDAHYMGGCILGSEMLSWSSQMQIWNVRPPHPYFVKDWKSLWRQRLELSSKSWVGIWLSHQLRDDYWKHGSVCEDPARIKIPILAIGGWQDGYVDAVFRMASTVPNIKCIVGPWGHDWADIATAGPNIDYLQLCLNWWDEHLKGHGSISKDMPLMGLYVQESIPPMPKVIHRNGFWIAQDEWPPREEARECVFVPDFSNQSLVQLHTSRDFTPSSISVPFSSSHGLFAGDWMSYCKEERSGDQRMEDAVSLTFTSSPLEEDLVLLGNAEVICFLSIQGNDCAQVAVRLSHVLPDGRSTRITYGLQNLTHQGGHAKITLLEENRLYKVRVQMVATSYIIPKGERLRLAIAQNYWPVSWTPQKITNMLVHLTSEDGQEKTQLCLPVYRGPRDTYMPPKLPETSREPAVTPSMLKRGSYRQFAEIDTSSYYRQVKVEDDTGLVFIKDTDTLFQDKCDKTYKIREDDTLSASAEIRHNMKYNYEHHPDGPVRCHMKTESKMWADEQNFFVREKLRVMINGEQFFENVCMDEIPRNGV